MAIKLNNDILDIIQDKIYKHTGIQLNRDKKIMIENRMNRLLDKLDITSDNYVEVIDTLERRHLQDFINVFTTNKTNFFREVKQFDYLFNNILPDLFNNGFNVNIYCSASSTGEEPWSIATTCELASKKSKFKYCNYNILATDIDTDILKRAKAGKYICQDFNKQSLPFWVSSHSIFNENVRPCKEIDNNYMDLTIKKELRKNVVFKQMNLMDNKYIVPKDNFYNVVFCRNVLIYFSKEDQIKVITKLSQKVKLNGYLFLGHSENLNGLDEYFERIGNNIFKKIKDF
jgi:chemotaxis protein methyltransferase CheR